MKFIAFFVSWFGGIRWRELAAICTAAYYGGLELAKYVHADAARAQDAAIVLAGVAGLCYFLNPKYSEWVQVLPQKQPVMPNAQNTAAPRDPFEEGQW